MAQQRPFHRVSGAVLASASDRLLFARWDEYLLRDLGGLPFGTFKGQVAIDVRKEVNRVQRQNVVCHARERRGDPRGISGAVRQRSYINDDLCSVGRVLL